MTTKCNEKLTSYFQLKEKRTFDEYNNGYNKEYGTWLDPMVPPFLMAMNSIIMFWEAVIILMKPLIKDNEIIQGLILQVFTIYLFIMKNTLYLKAMMKYLNESCISETNMEMINESYKTTNLRVTNIVSQVSDLIYEINKDEIDEFLTEEEQKNIAKDVVETIISTAIDKTSNAEKETSDTEKDTSDTEKETS